MRAFLLALAVAGLVALATAEESTIFRRTTADLASLQDSATLLEEEITLQRQHIGFVNRLASTVSDYNVVAAVSDDVRFLVERSLMFADAQDLVNLTMTLTAAASRAQELRLDAATHAAAVPALASAASRALATAIKEEGSYFEPTLAKTDSLEARYTRMRGNLDSALSTLTSHMDGYNATLTAVSEQAPAANAAADYLLAQVEAYQSVDFDALTSSLRQFHDFSGSRNRAVWWWNVWFTYSRYQSWFAGNQGQFFGGVAPSTWSDGGGTTGSMSRDMDVLRTLFTNRGSGGPNAMVWANEWYYTSSTMGQHTGVLLRIKNSTPNTINWSTYFYYTSYGSWSEYASVSLNGNQIWSTSTNSGPSNTAGVTVSFPANSVSTVIYVFGSGYPSSTRCTNFAFYNNCLNLPNGLSWVDDFTVAESLSEPLN